MPPRKQSAHAELDQLRQAAVQERMKMRDLEVALEGARREVDDISRSVTSAYLDEDEKLAAERRKELQKAEAKVVDVQHRLSAAETRVERAQREVDTFPGRTSTGSSESARTRLVRSRCHFNVQCMNASGLARPTRPSAS